MTEPYYAFYMDDPASPSFCSCSKIYIGTKVDMLRVAENLRTCGIYYEDTVAGIHAYFDGKTDVTHNIAYQDIPVLEPVEVLETSEMQIGAKEWVHLNAWDCPYKMRFTAAHISQVLLQKDGSFLRCIRASISNLQYWAFNNEWRLAGEFVFGNGAILDTCNKPDGSTTVRTILYVTEDQADSLEEQRRKMNDPDALVFDEICDEIFGDG